MRRSTHYHVTQHGRTSRPFRYQALAQTEALKLAGVNGTPSGFLPAVEPCYDPSCLALPIASQMVGRSSAPARTRERDWPGW